MSDGARYLPRPATITYCHKVEKRQRWTDGRYRCDRIAGHEGKCSAWSRSASGRQVFEGFEPCKCMKEGERGCDCILGDDE